MKPYLDIVQRVMDEGVVKDNRTGIKAVTMAGASFEHDMSNGFPLLTTKSVPFRLVASELEFFIKGITDKKWLQDRNNHIWDQWCNPLKVPYGHDKETKEKMEQERDLGPIYGWQWRHFGAEYDNHDTNYDGKGIDQLKIVTDRLKTNPSDRRMVVSAWNPMDLDKMALPACHYGFVVVMANDKLNLVWDQRSVDTMLGLPFNIASYGLLLHLLARDSGFEEGKLVGHLKDVHIYENHNEAVNEQLNREPYTLPKIETKNFTSLLDWKYEDSEVIGYKHHPRIRMDIAV